jgi:hypothetical protein
VAAGWISKEIRASRHGFLIVTEVGNSRLRLWRRDGFLILQAQSKIEGRGASRAFFLE